MSSKDSDQATWSYIPASTCNDATEPAIIATESTTTHHHNQDPAATTTTATATATAPDTEKTSDLPPTLLPSVSSLSRLFNDGIDDGDWSVFMPDSPLDPACQEIPQQPVAVTTREGSKALDPPSSLEAAPSLEEPSSLEAAPSLEEPSSLEWENEATPGQQDNDDPQQTRHPSTPPPPDNNSAVEQDHEEAEEGSFTTLPENAPPALFRGLSIESMYSLWTNSTSSLFAFEDGVVDDITLPNKRLKHTNSDGSNNSSNSDSSHKTTDNNDTSATGINIYKEIHTRILI